MKFSKEQVKERLLIRFGDGKFLHVVDSWDPNQYSIELATVFACSKTQTNYEPGQILLVDFAIYTTGIYKERFKNAQSSRKLAEDDEFEYYWAYDGQGAEDSEIFATVFDGNVVPRDDILILFGPEKKTKPKEGMECLLYDEDPEDDWELINGIYAKKPTRDEAPFFATVFASSISEIDAGDEIYCPPGVTPRIKYNELVLEYVLCGFVLGIRKKGTQDFKLL